MSDYTEGDLIVGSTSSGGVRRIWRITGYAGERAWDIESGAAVNLSKLFGVQRAAVNRVADLIPKVPKKRFCKAKIDKTADTNFHIFDYETHMYASFASESTRNQVLNDLNGGSEVSFHTWTNRPQIGAEEAPVVINNFVRYVESLVDSNDENFHIYDTVTGMYASYKFRGPRDRHLADLNAGRIGHLNTFWRDKPLTKVVKPDHTELLAVTQMMIEAHDLINPKSPTAALLRRLKNALARGN